MFLFYISILTKARVILSMLVWFTLSNLIRNEMFKFSKNKTWHSQFYLLWKPIKAYTSIKKKLWRVSTYLLREKRILKSLFSIRVRLLFRDSIVDHITCQLSVLKRVKYLIRCNFSNKSLHKIRLKLSVLSKR